MPERIRAQDGPFPASPSHYGEGLCSCGFHSVKEIDPSTWAGLG